MGRHLFTLKNIGLSSLESSTGVARIATANILPDKAQRMPQLSLCKITALLFLANGREPATIDLW